MRRSSFHLWGKNLITFQVLQHCSVHYFWLLRFLRKPRIHTLVGRRNKALNKTKKVYLHFFMELTFILLVCFLDKNVILFALYCHSSVCAGLQGLYLHNLHWSSRNTWSVLCNMKTITFTNFPCIFFLILQGISHSYTEISVVVSSASLTFSLVYSPSLCIGLIQTEFFI